MAGRSGSDSPSFNAVNRGKRGIVLDLKSAAGQAAFRRLAGRADVIIENYRPGVMRRFGLDYAALSAENPGLIYASISGYGQTGPSASKGGFDLVAQGVSGLMSITGEPGRPPVKTGGAADRSRRRAVCAVGDPRRADLPLAGPGAGGTSTRRSSKPASRSPSGRPPSSFPARACPGRWDRPTV